MKAKSSDCESVQDVLNRVSHADLLHYYLGIDSLPVLISSPLRTDRHPSFFIYSPDGSRVFYKDYATGEKGDIYALIARKEGLSFAQVIRKVSADSRLAGNPSDTTLNASLPSAKKFSPKTPRELKVRVREWKDYDIEWWKQWGISLEWLKYAEVYPISHKIIYKAGERFVIHAAKYAYVFVERKDGIVSLKVYSPTSQSYKWDNSMDSSVWGLWTKIPQKGNNLIISSSVKDCLNLWSNLGIPSVCMQGEGYTPKPQVIDELKSRYKNIIVFFDNDYNKENNPGRTDSIKLATEYNLKRVEIPNEYEAKDPSDFYKKYGKEKYMEVMCNLIKPLLWKNGE